MRRTILSTRPIQPAAILLLVALSSVVPTGTASAEAPAPSVQDAVPGEFLVRVDDAAAAVAATGGDIEPLGLGWALLTAPRDLRAAAAAPLEVVTGAELYPNLVSVPLDEPLQDQQWGLAAVDAPGAWEVTSGRAGVVVAVLDTGIDLEHPELSSQLWVNPDEIPGNGRDDDDNGHVDDVNGWDVVADDPRPDDSSSHGTMVAGIVAAAIDGRGVAGVAPGVRLMPLRVCGEVCTDADLITALGYAAAEGAAVANLSLGRPAGPFDDPLHDAVRQAGDAGVLVIAAAGNRSEDADVNPLVPAAFEGDTIVSVAGTDPDGSLGDYSNWGEESVDLGAPGTAILTTSPIDDGEHADGTGTSFAAPHVAGAAALVVSANACASPAEVREILLATSNPEPSLAGRTVSGGGLDAAAAVGAALSRHSGSMQVEASASPGFGGIPLTVELSGSSRCDPTGRLATYRWVFGGGGAETGRAVDHRYDSLGVYRARLTVTAPTGASSTETVDVVAGMPFVDLALTIFDGEIYWMSAEGITIGCSSDGPRFCPTASVTRGQMASFLARALGLTGDAEVFFDDDGSTHEDAINALARAGITVGCDQTGRRFCPDDPVTRGQMASFLTRAFDLPDGPDAFSDDEGSVHEASINALAASRITRGCTTDRYCPMDPISRGQMAAFLFRARDLLP